MPRVYIRVGSNIDPEVNIHRALRMLADATAVVAISTFYRTPAIGAPNSPEFINGVVAIETEIEPREFKSAVLRKVEKALGRLRGPDKYEPRTIDLDILIYGDLVASEDDLVIPDPDLTKRAFLALPLLELEPELMLPGSDKRLAEAARELDGRSMTPLHDLTRELRQETHCEP